MQTAQRFASGFQRHFTALIHAANPQAHIPAAQLVVIGFVIDVGQLTRGVVLMWRQASAPVFRRLAGGNEL